MCEVVERQNIVGLTSGTYAAAVALELKDVGNQRSPKTITLICNM